MRKSGCNQANAYGLLHCYAEHWHLVKFVPTVSVGAVCSLRLEDIGFRVKGFQKSRFERTCFRALVKEAV